MYIQLLHKSKICVVHDTTSYRSPSNASLARGDVVYVVYGSWRSRSWHLQRAVSGRLFLPGFVFSQVRAKLGARRSRYSATTPTLAGCPTTMLTNDMRLMSSSVSV